MTLDTQKFAAANQATVDSLVTVANAAMAAAERIVALNMDTTRVAIDDSAAAAKSLLGASDAQSALAAQQALVQPAVEKAVSYTQSLYAISNEAQQEISKLFEAQVAEFQKASADLLKQFSGNAPAGSEVFVKAMNDAFSKATEAFGTATAMSKQITAATQAAVVAATPKAKAKK